jgi:hypothetical protein
MVSSMTDFETLKINRKRNFETIKDAFDSENYDQREKSSSRLLLNRLKDALVEVDNIDLFNRIISCDAGQRCASLWCNHCRNQAAQTSEKRIKSYIEKHRLLNQSLLHLTAPVGLCDLSVSSVKNILKEDGLRWKRIRKRQSFWIEATYEFELVNLNFLMRSSGSEFKKKQIQHLVQHYRIPDKEFLFVHWHGITDLTENEIGNAFRQEYHFGRGRLIKTSSSGLYIQKLHEDKSLDNNIKKISSYPFKSVYRFKHSFKGSDYSNGEYFTNTELGNIVTLYQNVQGRQWRSLRRNSN